MAGPTKPGPYDMASTYLHLRDGGGATPVAVGPTFWDDLIAGKNPELVQGRLMGQFAFEVDWPVWERHPHGEELIMLISGACDFVLQQAHGEQVMELRAPGDYVLVPTGTWHTARARGRSTILFVTPGLGTDHRPVNPGRD